MKVLVYGTLREGEYNYDRIKRAFGSDSIKKVGETTVNGFKMHNLGPYPAITQSEESDTIVCDILEVSPKAADFIDAMEEGAGYQRQNTKEGLPIYVYDRAKAYPVISSGNWKKRKANV